MLIIIDQKISVHKVGIYRADTQLVDGTTSKILDTSTQLIEGKPVRSAMRTSLKIALDVAIQLGGTSFIYQTNYFEHSHYATSLSRLRLVDSKRNLYEVCGSSKSVDHGDDDDYEDVV